MSKVFLMGECMAELLQLEANLLQQAFAGDVVNTAVYMKRAYPDVDAGVLTAVGQDALSNKMLDFFRQQHLNTQLVCKSATRIPGLYWINTDAVGERSFTYWRENSAARELMSLLDAEKIAALSQADWFFFSGISLAVITPADREKFWLLLNELRSAGVKVAFDPNYRARLWASKVEAQECFAKAFSACDLLLPGIDDFAQLYGLSSISEIKHFLTDFDIAETVIKNGPEQVCVLVNGSEEIIPIVPVTNVVDTTSAGDSFNGVYLGARISGEAVTVAVHLAAKSAALVIQHRGAIIPLAVFDKFWKNIKL
jgi:2-dehydro-3-deoxygluconokinase